MILSDRVQEKCVALIHEYQAYTVVNLSSIFNSEQNSGKYSV